MGYLVKQKIPITQNQKNKILDKIRSEIDFSKRERMKNLLKGCSWKTIAYFPKRYPNLYFILREEYGLNNKDHIVVYQTNPLPVQGSSDRKKKWSPFKTFHNGTLVDFKPVVYSTTWGERNGHFRKWLKSRK